MFTAALTSRRLSAVVLLQLSELPALLAMAAGTSLITAVHILSLAFTDGIKAQTLHMHMLHR